MAAQRRRSDKLLERIKNNPRGNWQLSDGETLEETIENGKDALQCWLEAAAADGQKIPEPGSSPTWIQQVPNRVHIQLSQRAEAEGMSLSEFVASILDQATDDTR